MILQILIPYLYYLSSKIWFTVSAAERLSSTTKVLWQVDTNLLPITARKVPHAWRLIRRIIYSFKPTLLGFSKISKILSIFHDHLQDI